MKSLMLLWSNLARELAGWCHTSATLDIKTVECRSKCEGQSFLTITLPEFGKSFEQALDTGLMVPQHFQAFAWKRGLPVFLQGFLEQIFDRNGGRLLDDPNIDAIYAVRQLTLLYSKLFLLSNEKRERAAMLGYIQCEQEVAMFASSYSDDLRKDFRRVANIVFGRTLRKIEISLEDPLSVMPKHGPGATADGFKGNQKWQQKTWTKRLEAVFPSIDHLLPNPSFFEELADVHFLEPEDEVPVKVISVPKTQKTPRIIAIEPTCMQFMQQAVQRRFYECVDDDSLSSALIGYLDQEPNRLLARKGSLNGDLATLDLSEASDRISYEHVEDLLAFNPYLFRMVDACRSTKARVPGHGVIPLSKFASMGSALSFPLEAMVFTTIVFMGIEAELNRPLTRNDVKSFMGKVRVFGDDIIVPVDCVNSVIEFLTRYGMKVNSNKSFWTGRFRESCGKEYFAGHDVSIVKVRQLPPTSLRNAQEVISWVSLGNLLYKQGCWQTVKWLDSFMSGILKDYPVVEETSPVLGRHSLMGFLSHKTGGRYQIPLVKGYVTSVTIPINRLDEYHALQKWFLLRGDLPFADEDHLERSGRPFVVDIKRKWASPF